MDSATLWYSVRVQGFESAEYNLGVLRPLFNPYPKSCNMQGHIASSEKTDVTIIQQKAYKKGNLK